MKYFLIIIEAFLLSWSPYVAVSFLKIPGKTITTTACTVFAKMSFFINHYAMLLFQDGFNAA